MEWSPVPFPSSPLSLACSLSPRSLRTRNSPERERERESDRKPYKLALGCQQKDARNQRHQ
jgi:hypothetical protein